MNTTNIKRGKNKKGFTLVEVIVVLVIIAILIAIAVPAVMKYVDDANDTKDDLSVRHLNQATESYKIHLYADNELKEDIFDGITTDEKRQEKLKELGWIDDLQTSIYDDDNYFHWNVDKQVWERKPSTSNPDDPVKPDNKEPDLSQTILGPLYDNGKDISETFPDWKNGVSYNVGDVVRADNGKYYKLNYDSGAQKKPNDAFQGSEWKELTLQYTNSNKYETGDIVSNSDTGDKTKYYIVVYEYKTTNPNEFSGILIIYEIDGKSALGNHEFFKEVKWDPNTNSFIDA